MKALMENKYFREVLSYGIFGVLTTLVNILVFKLLIDVRVNYLAATSTAFVVSVLFAYVTNRKWVFYSEVSDRQGVLRELMRFFSSRIATFIMETAGLVILIQMVKMDPFMSKLAMTVLVVVMNYVLSKVLIFK